MNRKTTQSSIDVSQAISQVSLNKTHNLIIETIEELKHKYPKVNEKLNSLENEVFLIDDDKIEASVLIDSQNTKAIIRITTGCFNQLKNNEIKAILAHEIGHVMMGHREKLNNFKLAYLISIGTIIFLLLLSGLISGIYLILFLFPIFYLFLSKSSAKRQNHEFQADRFSATVFEPQDMLMVLRYLDKDEKQSNSIMIKINKIIGTHPSIKDRIKKIEQMV